MTPAIDGYRTPPQDRLTTPPRSSAKNTVNKSQLETPTSVKWESPKPRPPVRDVLFAAPRMQKEVDSSPAVKRLQQDLLILTGFNDNSSLHWRPAWFDEGRFEGSMWTLHNPPNVVTEPLPNNRKGMQLYTRRMRRGSDLLPQYIKSWDHWARYCDIYGIPHDFLSEEQVRLMRTGLPRAADGSSLSPPQYPLYPEPSHRGAYMLAPSMCSTHLPRKFQQIVIKTEPRAVRKRNTASLEDDQDSPEFVVVEPDGKLSVVAREDLSLYARAGSCYRWSYLPWTEEMEKSCRPLKLKLRLWNDARDPKNSRLAG